jgi:hypothetical protein
VSIYTMAPGSVSGGVPWHPPPPPAPSNKRNLFFLSGQGNPALAAGKTDGSYPASVTRSDGT